MDRLNVNIDVEFVKFDNYRKLLRLRRMIIFLFFSPAIFKISTGFSSGFFGESLLSILHAVDHFYFPIPFFITFYISINYFMCKNICPWCGEAFFGKTMGLFSSLGLDLLFRRSCANCGRPGDVRKEEDVP